MQYLKLEGGSKNINVRRQFNTLLKSSKQMQALKKQILRLENGTRDVELRRRFNSVLRDRRSISAEGLHGGSDTGLWHDGEYLSLSDIPEDLFLRGLPNQIFINESSVELSRDTVIKLLIRDRGNIVIESNGRAYYKRKEEEDGLPTGFIFDVHHDDDSQSQVYTHRLPLHPKTGKPFDIFKAIIDQGLTGWMPTIMELKPYFSMFHEIIGDDGESMPLLVYASMQGKTEIMKELVHTCYGNSGRLSEYCKGEHSAILNYSLLMTIKHNHTQSFMALLPLFRIEDDSTFQHIIRQFAVKFYNEAIAKELLNAGMRYTRKHLFKALTDGKVAYARIILQGLHEEISIDGFQKENYFRKYHNRAQIFQFIADESSNLFRRESTEKECMERMREAGFREQDSLMLMVYYKYLLRKRAEDGEEDVAAKLNEVIAKTRGWYLPERSAVTENGQGGKVRLSPDERQIVTTTETGIAFWDSALQNMKHVDGQVQEHMVMDFSSDGSKIATGSLDTTIIIWDAKCGDGPVCKLQTLEGHNGEVYSVCFSPDGTMLASASWDTDVKLWDVETGKCLQTFSGHSDDAFCVSFSPDGLRIASGAGDDLVKVWDVGSGEEVQCFDGHTDLIYGVSFSPDGLQLASSSQDNTIKVWDLSTGELSHTLYGHVQSVYDVEFSADGSTIVSCSDDGTVRVWDVATRTCFNILYGLNSVYGVAMSKDGTKIVASDFDGRMHVWKTTPWQEWMKDM